MRQERVRRQLISILFARDATVAWVPVRTRTNMGTQGCSSSLYSLFLKNSTSVSQPPSFYTNLAQELDAVVSGASDGRIVQHCLKDGRYVRQYFCSPEAADCAGSPTLEANQLAFSCQGDVVAHSWTDLSLHRFSLNGARLASASALTAMSCLLTAGGGEFLLAGGRDGLIRVYALHDLSVVHAIDLQDHGGVTCMRLSPNDEYLLAGSEDGEVSIITDARKRLRMLDLALRRAFVG